ncbi:hypothetical protein BH09ACT10_BH09ACT10_26260 [soil metagenome]
MPKVTTIVEIIHEPWCEDHGKDEENESCQTFPVFFGPKFQPSDGSFSESQVGEVFAYRGVDDSATTVAIDASGVRGSLSLRPQDLVCLKYLLEAFSTELLVAVTEMVVKLDAEVTA